MNTQGEHTKMTITTAVKLNERAQNILNEGAADLQNQFPVERLTHPAYSAHLEALASKVVLANSRGTYVDKPNLVKDLRNHFRQEANKK